MIELLAVMSIAALLTTVAVTSYFSAVRGMGRRSAIKHLASTLTVARQRACMDNARVSVVLFNEVSGVDEDSNKLLVTPSYVICKEMGRITYARGDALVDEFSALDAIFGKENTAGAPDDYQDFSEKAGIKLYNLTEGGYSYVRPRVKMYKLDSESVYIKKPDHYYIDEGAPGSLELHPFSFTVNTSAGQSTASWKIGDSYGIEASPVQNLPRGFQFGGMDDNQNAFEYITFLPSGRAEFSSGGSIRIEELRPPNRSVTMRVDSSGEISYNNNW